MQNKNNRLMKKLFDSEKDNISIDDEEANMNDIVVRKKWVKWR